MHHLPRLKQRAHTNPTFTARSNVYDARQHTYDGAGADVTRITHEVRSLARWAGRDRLNVERSWSCGGGKPHTNQLW